jgi:hypothetical protein
MKGVFVAKRLAKRNSSFANLCRFESGRFCHPVLYFIAALRHDFIHRE